jgi:hypothetical protein
MRGKRTAWSAEAGDRTKERLKTTAKFWEKRTLGVVMRRGEAGHDNNNSTMVLQLGVSSLKARSDPPVDWLSYGNSARYNPWLAGNGLQRVLCTRRRSRITIPSRKIDGCPEPRIKRHGQACGGHGRGTQLQVWYGWARIGGGGCGRFRCSKIEQVILPPVREKVACLFCQT